MLKKKKKACETQWTLTLYPVYFLRSKLDFKDHILSSKPAALKSFHPWMPFVGGKVPGIQAISSH